jgi:hypothetical protein
MNKKFYQKQLTEINLFMQEMEVSEKDYRKLYRNMRAIQSYLEKNLKEARKKD